MPDFQVNRGADSLLSIQETPEEGHVAGDEGLNDFGKYTYGGPCPPSGEHRYFFKLFALDNKLNISHNSTKSDVEKAMEGHIKEQAELVGLYSRE